MDYRESFYSAVTDSASPFADQIREWCAAMMKRQIPNKPELWEKLTPKYSPGCKRVIITDDYYPAIADAKTTLETEKIVRVTETGVEVDDGHGGTRHHEHDM
jgi:cation diffusion facilitator CzcD-associated flavoprotein CzcO